MEVKPDVTLGLACPAVLVTAPAVTGVEVKANITLGLTYPAVLVITPAMTVMEAES
jgi:hypothetical protein